MLLMILGGGLLILVVSLVIWVRSGPPIDTNETTWTPGIGAKWR